MDQQDSTISEKESSNKTTEEKQVVASKVSGTVKWFSTRSGYGFINRDDNQEDVFVHQTSIARSGNHSSRWRRGIDDGERVEFDVVRGSKGFEAVEVTGPGGSPLQGSTRVRKSNESGEGAGGNGDTEGRRGRRRRRGGRRRRPYGLPLGGGDGGGDGEGGGGGGGGGGLPESQMSSMQPVRGGLGPSGPPRRRPYTMAGPASGGRGGHFSAPQPMPASEFYGRGRGGRRGHRGGRRGRRSAEDPSGDAAQQPQQPESSVLPDA